ncbi:MAG: response regulator transcription factor [Microbacteriaceae bacterium]|nr:response regulator transcription factor [Microbacteriaceae bacterium]
MEGRLLVVEDDPQVRAVLSRALGYEGFDVLPAPDGATALAAASADAPDLVLLDRILPDLDGVEVCRRMRQAGARAPILMVSARDTVADRVAGLDAGADDFLAKPFSTAELVARVRALLRRSRARDRGRVRRYADLRMDTATREVQRGGRAIRLTRREFDLLALFLAHPERAMSRELLLTEAWGFSPGLRSNAVDVYVGYLRRKLEEGGEPRLIHTVRGIGYALRRDPVTG